MKFPMIICRFALPFLVVTSSLAEPPKKESRAVTIPLTSIWAYNMPGTRELQKMEDRRVAKQIEGIRRALSQLPPQGKEAGKGIAVLGTGVDALAEAHAVLVEGKKPRKTFPVDSEVSIFFYSYESGFYVHLRSITRQGNSIEIRYRFVTHKTKELTQHFALIPLGKITPGQFPVEIIQAPMPEEFIKAGWKPVKSEVVKRIVCKSFSFLAE
jgi:hypothetical protein